MATKTTTLLKQFISYCKKGKLEHNVGYDWCECNDFGDFVNVKVNGKWHTLYALDSGAFRFDKTIVETIEDIENLLK